MTAFEFGPYRLEPATRLFLRGGEAVPLPPKAFDTLLFLVEHRERAVTKDELLRALWRDVVVEEASLAQQVFLLRKALSDTSDQAEYIATIPKCGYRFVAPIRQLSSPPPSESVVAAELAAEVWPRRWGGRVAWLAAVVAAAVAVVGSVWALHSRPAPSVTRLAVVPPPGTLSWGSPVVSPEGRSVAFSARTRDGLKLLWVRPFDSPTAVALTGTDGAEFPFWSPDGASLAFFAQGKLKKIKALGGIAQILCDASAGRGGTWSRDQVIVFAPDARSGLFRVSAAGGSPVQITWLGKSPVERSHRFPHFLEDGRHFIYFSLRNNSPHVLAIGSLDSPESREVLSGARGEAYAPPGFMVFSLEGTLVARAYDLSHLRLVGGAQAIADYVPPGSVTGHENLSASTNGVLSYLGGTSRTSELVWYDRRGRRLGTMGPPGDYRQLALSRDESHAAVMRVDPVTRQHEIWVIDGSRDSISRVTASPPGADDPVWSPDGRRIAFSSSTRSGLGDVLVKEWGDAGGRETVLSSDGNNYVHDWSPDGKLVLFAREEEPTPIRNLWTVPVSATRSPTLFMRTRFQKAVAHFSPDGRWVAYVSDESGNSEVYVTSFPEPDITRQVSSGGGEQPQWRRDGHELFFISADGMLMASSIDADAGLTTGVPQSLFSIPGSRSELANPLRGTYAVAGNGDRFLINTLKADDLVPLNVVLNWTSLLTGR